MLVIAELILIHLLINITGVVVLFFVCLTKFKKSEDDSITISMIFFSLYWIFLFVILFLL